jgi:hypothetical protein
LEGIPAGTDLAVFRLALTMEDVFLRGKYLGVNRIAGVCAAMAEIDWGYNPVPSVPGQIYPPVELQVTREF